MTVEEKSFQLFCYPGRPVIDYREELNEPEKRAYYYLDKPVEEAAQIMNVTVERMKFYIKRIREKGWCE